MVTSVVIAIGRTIGKKERAFASINSRIC